MTQTQLDVEAGIYAALLLRFWRDDERSSWRASLESSDGRTSLVFACVADLQELLDGFLSGLENAGTNTEPPSLPQS